MKLFHIPLERIYFLDKDSKNLLGGAKFISALQAHNLQGGMYEERGASILPAQPRIEGREEIVVGLHTVVGDLTKKNYFVCDILGNPIQGGRYKYSAPSPSAAAVKAFYAWWRTSKQGDKCVNPSEVEFKMSLVPKELVQYLETLESSKVTNEQKKEYVKQFLCIDKKKISREIIIRIGTAGKNGSIRFYSVNYRPNLKPNTLEILNRMVVMASANLIKSDSMPTNAVEFQTLLT
jgi:hypothetical protein